MQDQNAETLEIVVPGEDEPIAKALAELDSKLAAFTDAMRAATATVRAGAAAVRSDKSAGAVEGIPGKTQPQVEVREEPNAALPPPADGSAKEPAPAPKTPKPGSEPSVGTTGQAQKKKRGIVSMMPPQPEPATDLEPAAGAPAPAGAEADEDEALLASLDAETAAAIRVMRRVSVERKSVRELLEQYQAGHKDAPQSGGDKKSWWTRGRR